MERELLAKEYFQNGYNCAQAVALSFKDLLDIDEKSLQNIASGFGGGIASLKQTCGCVTGMAMVISLLYPNDKAKKYQLIQKLSMDFNSRFGSLSCGILLASGSKLKTSNRPHNETCYDYVGYMAKIMQEELENGKD